MKKDTKNKQASIRAQLQNNAKKTNRPFAEILQYYGMERFLYRFSRSQYADKMKDFYDIWLMMRQLNFDGQTLTEALKRTFEHRKTSFPERSSLFAEEIYDDGSDRQILWKAFLKKKDSKHTPEKLSVIAKAIENFLAEPINAIIKLHKFNLKWEAPGPWRP